MKPQHGPRLDVFRGKLTAEEYLPGFHFGGQEELMSLWTPNQHGSYGPLAEGMTGFFGLGQAPGRIACYVQAKDLEILHSLEWGCESPGKTS